MPLIPDLSENGQAIGKALSQEIFGRIPAASMQLFDALNPLSWPVDEKYSFCRNMQYRDSGVMEIIQHADEQRTGKSLNEYQFSITSSDESAQRATSDGKLIRVQGFSCPEVMSACCITIPGAT